MVRSNLQFATVIVGLLLSSIEKKEKWSKPRSTFRPRSDEPIKFASNINQAPARFDYHHQKDPTTVHHCNKPWPWHFIFPQVYFERSDKFLSYWVVLW